MIPSIARESLSFIVSSVIPQVNEFRTYQNPQGSIPAHRNVVRTLLESLCQTVQTAYERVGAPAQCSQAFQADVESWLSRGLESAPCFDLSLKSFVPPEPDTLTFFIAPSTLSNGPLPRGAFLECFLAYREEPSELGHIFAPTPQINNVCQSCRLLTGSYGLLTGNCLVFFPENVSTEAKVETQPFALSFSNKFQRIFFSETLPRTQKLFREHTWLSSLLSPTDCYRAHCIWSYMHDYFHQCGPRPLHKNLRVKMNFFAGLLEETKVDCQVVATLMEKQVPFRKEIVEFILCERLLRYPNQLDATTNFDAGAGLFLFQWLLHHQHGLYETRYGLHLDIKGCIAGMSALAKEIEALETHEDDAEYRSLAQQFVRTFLPASAQNVRYDIPEKYIVLTRADRTEAPLLTFDNLPY